MSFSFNIILLLIVMPNEHQHLYEAGKPYVITDSERFNACVEYYGNEDDKDKFRSQSPDGQIIDATILISNGINNKGYATFKIAIGEVWRHAVIVSNITIKDHPLNIGLKNYKGPKLNRTNYETHIL